MTPEVRERLDTFIKAKGLRRTAQRDAIVDEIFASEEHFTADELWERLRGAGQGTSRATLYRTLSLLTEANLLQEIDLGDGQTTYDPNFLDRPSHNHLVCVDCGKVIEFEDEHLEVLNDCITRRLGFRAVKQSLRIEACCDELRTKGRCPNLIEARLQGKRLPGKKR
ncbi:MAG: transcriptional repressor [Akkermansiaceae bacterium]|nr:transcriptional repressor [Akkermansiaceae bacterium]NNM30563.1 transcriptional repressor [Akkermansiaceae bacterium]